MNKKIYAYGIAFTLFLHCSSLVAGVQLRLSHPNVRIGNGMVAYKGKQIVVNGRPLGSCLSSKDFGLDDLVIEGRKDGHAYVNGQKVAEDGTVTVPTDAASQAAYKKSLPTMKGPEMPHLPQGASEEKNTLLPELIFIAIMAAKAGLIGGAIGMSIKSDTSPKYNFYGDLIEEKPASTREILTTGMKCSAAGALVGIILSAALVINARIIEYKNRKKQQKKTS